MSDARRGQKSMGKVVLVDDIEANRNLLSIILRREGYSVCPASDGLSALALVVSETPDLVITDVVMPGIDGFELCRRVKSTPATRLTPVIVVTSLAERDDRIAGINAGADDFLTKPFDPHEFRARVRSLVSLKRYTDDLDSADSVILSLGLTVEARDNHTSGHCQRMAAFAAAFGTHLELPAEDIAALHRGGYLHDVGKIGVPDAILLKPGPLSPAEFETMKRHTVVGDALCGDLRLLKPVRPIIRHHHERWDGSGYPDGLRGDAIPLLAQIMGIVDVYDALTSDRPYRKALTEDAALDELRKETQHGRRRPDLVATFTGIAATGRLNVMRPVPDPAISNELRSTRASPACSSRGS